MALFCLINIHTRIFANTFAMHICLSQHVRLATLTCLPRAHMYSSHAKCLFFGIKHQYSIKYLHYNMHRWKREILIVCLLLLFFKKSWFQVVYFIHQQHFEIAWCSLDARCQFSCVQNGSIVGSGKYIFDLFPLHPRHSGPVCWETSFRGLFFTHAACMLKCEPEKSVEKLPKNIITDQISAHNYRTAWKHCSIDFPTTF
jgi:hypothetical protein